MSAEKAAGCDEPSRLPDDWDVRLDKLLQENNDRLGWSSHVETSFKI